MARKVGYVLMAIALIHTFFGFVFFPGPIMDVIRAGMFNTIVEPFHDRNGAFWFFIFGAMLALYGGMTQWLIDSVGRLPRFWGWGFLALCVVGVFFMPASGFWLGIPPAIVMIRQTPETNATRQPLMA